MHKTINVLNCSPKSAQAKVKGSLHDIWQTESKAVAEKAYELCIKMYEPKYPKASICLQKDRYGMLHMMSKLGKCAEKKWRRLRGCDYLTKVITGVKFNDGLEVTGNDLVAA
jgi:putative transposase